MRSLMLFVLLLGSTAAVAATVDLNAPGALEQLRVDNPRHYERVAEVIHRAETRPVREVATWIRTALDPNAEWGELWYVSYPPKARLAFTLDRTQYTIIVVDRSPAKLIPAK